MGNCEPELPVPGPIVSPVDIGSQIRTKKKKPINKTLTGVLRHCSGDTPAEGEISKVNTPESKLSQSIAMLKKKDPKFASDKKIGHGQVPLFPLVDPKGSAIKKSVLQIQNCFTVNVGRKISEKPGKHENPSTL